MMRDQFGNRYPFPAQTQYGENIPQPEMANLTASVIHTNQIQISVNVVASSSTPVLEFQVSTDENFAATSPILTFKMVNVSVGTKQHTFEHLSAGNYYVRTKLYNCSGKIEISSNAILSIP